MPDRSHAWRLCVAPMLDWTDRHCRRLHRLLSRHARLYTEMVTTGALIHGDRARHLDFDPVEQPVALQLGGSDPAELARCAAMAHEWGYAEVNLNCGCPSDRVQRGSFGACLMAQPELVAACVSAMREASLLPVTVKHRIGIDKEQSYGFVRDFVGTVAAAGCEVFMVHARNAWLQGLSPKQNRDVPPLRHEVVHRLKQDFPDLVIVVNGGIAGDEAIAGHLQHVDGVMIGRDAYQHPWHLAQWDERFFGEPNPASSREQVEQAYVEYLQSLSAMGLAWPAAARHMLGLYDGQPGARAWRRVWSDHRVRDLAPTEVSAQARAARLGTHRRLESTPLVADRAGGLHLGRHCGRQT